MRSEGDVAGNDLFVIHGKTARLASRGVVHKSIDHSFAVFRYHFVRPIVGSLTIGLRIFVRSLIALPNDSGPTLGATSCGSHRHIPN